MNHVSYLFPALLLSTLLIISRFIHFVQGPPGPQGLQGDRGLPGEGWPGLKVYVICCSKYIHYLFPAKD